MQSEKINTTTTTVVISSENRGIDSLLSVWNRQKDRRNSQNFSADAETEASAAMDSVKRAGKGRTPSSRTRFSAWSIDRDQRQTARRDQC